ncbi:hypothetical protein MN205_07895 [Kineococcus sp. TRM81007]|uniref:polysaccharide lyase n=1 Tax=Kineococcus sp. TRM81007 TaxID=2925831 RepID=UPI001F594BFA|nr:hypothetical protein [Kineococcus sp. TRM81007]MCI2238416.1 hypothetical protein [Kineococcus sp. TRM81007]
MAAVAAGLVAVLVVWLAVRDPRAPVDPSAAPGAAAPTPAPGVLWSGSFDPPPGTTWQEQAGVVVASRTNARVVAEGPGGREDVLEITFGEDGSRWGVDYRHDFEAMGVAAREEVWFSYDVHFPAGFEFTGDGKMGGLAGTVEGLDPLETSAGGTYDERSFSVRAVWRGERGVVMYLYARHGAGRDVEDPANYGYGIAVPFVGPDGSTSDVIRPGTWQRVQHRVRLNTPGKDDGTYELWIDGHRGVSVTDVQYRTAEHPDLLVDQLFSSWFFGGGEDQFPTRTSVAYTDDWVLSERRPVER